MAVGEVKKKWQISQVSWTDWVALDPYYWLEHSFQYSANINCDDELHWIKLSQKVINSSSYSKCQLVSWGNQWVIALWLNWWWVSKISCDGSSISGSSFWPNALKNPNIDNIPWTIFQDRFWYWVSVSWVNWVVAIDKGWNYVAYAPIDHPEATDESIETPVPVDQQITMWQAITAILNYNNTRLVVACGTEIWVYYPELDRTWETIWWQQVLPWHTWWKKVLDYEAWVMVVWLTCTFEYLKVWAVDEWWNTKIYYYQGNNNLRDTFVYNVIDLTWEKVTRVYSINSVDYYVTSVDWTDWYVNLNKMIGNVPVPLFKQRAWLTALDINFKDPYFVWPCSIDAGYQMWAFYIADSYWVFKFNFSPNSYDKGYMKWKLFSSTTEPHWLCINQNFLYVSYDDWVHAVRIYDTGKDWYQDEWVLISREFEWKEWGTFTKMLDEIRLAYELNPLTDDNWSIDIYVSPNNLWTWTDPEDDEWWYKVLHIDQTNWNTRTEKSNLFNDLDNWESAFKFDWQTITYAIVIKVWDAIQATPIVRQLDIIYHTKDKLNNVYDIQN